MGQLELVEGPAQAKPHAQPKPLRADLGACPEVFTDPADDQIAQPFLAERLDRAALLRSVCQGSLTAGPLASVTATGQQSQGEHGHCRRPSHTRRAGRRRERPRSRSPRAPAWRPLGSVHAPAACRPSDPRGWIRSRSGHPARTCRPAVRTRSRRVRPHPGRPIAAEWRGAQPAHPPSRDPGIEMLGRESHREVEDQPVTAVGVPDRGS